MAEALLRVRAGAGAEQLVSRATLARATYFEARLDRWPAACYELDMDPESFGVILTLLRYGAAAVPRLDPPLREMVLHDADYLGVPQALWAHLVKKSPEEELAELSNRLWEWGESKAGWLAQCTHCLRPLRHEWWACIKCARVSHGPWVMTQRSNGGDIRLIECSECGPSYARRRASCLSCRSRDAE